LKIINNRKAIAEVISRNPWDSQGKSWDVNEAISALNTGEILALTKENNRYFLHFKNEANTKIALSNHASNP
jgi:hypothetical protein